VKQLADRGEIADAAKSIVPDHPWPAVSLAAAIDVHTGALLHEAGTAALAWRGGNPWDPTSPTVHALGDPKLAAQLLTALAAAGERLIGTPETLSALPIAHEHYEWDLRSLDRPGSGAVRDASNGGGPEVEWLPPGPSAEREVNALLDHAFPHAAIRPGDERVGRWCGVRDDDGVLVACAAETLPAAPIAHLSALAVLPRVRRRQLGAAVTRFFLT
jgi:hypothetical protein